MKSSISAFRATSDAIITAALLSIVFGWNAVHAAPQDIILQDGCDESPPQIWYSAKPGDTVSTEVSVTFVDGGPRVFWELATSSGCTGTESAIQCAPNGASPPTDHRFSVTAPTGAVLTTTAAGRVQITNAGSITNADIGRQGIFTTTVTNAEEEAEGKPTCPRSYLLRVTNTGGGWGDPHITTVDGLHYDFQSAGEFTALKEDDLEIQTRQKAVPTTTIPGPSEHTGLGVCVSVYSAVAARIGSNRVSLQPNLSGEPDPSGLQLRVNGELVTLTDKGIDLRAGGSGNDLRAGGSAESATQLEGRITQAAGGAYVFTDARGTQLVATPAYWESQQTWYLNLNAYQTSATQGIWGRLVSDSTDNMGGGGNWLPALPDGTSLGSRPTALDQRYRDLYETFADAWRVTDATSLFDYAPGTGTATFTLAEWPRFEPRSCLIEGQTPAEPTDPDTAEQACSTITDHHQKADCIFDVTVTGHAGFVQAYETMQAFEPHGSGWQPTLAGIPLSTTDWPWWWWWWILIAVLVLIVIAVLIARKKTTV